MMKSVSICLSKLSDIRDIATIYRDRRQGPKDRVFA